MADSETATDDSGQYSFTGLRAGTYSVEISGFDSNEVSFSSTSGAATVGVGESKVVSFDGTYLRTAGIMGRVSAEGEGLPNVTVTLMGQGDDIPPATTDAGGLYSFSQLRSGDYTVAISGYDTDDYEFETTSKSVTIATGEAANVPFEGTLLRTAGIAGRVSVGGMGLDDVEVKLAGAAEAMAMTSNGGQYAFAGLAAGTYVVSITNPNDVAYSFEATSMNVELMDDDSEIVNFEGTHTRTASVSGVLFIDEVMQDKMHNEGEPSVAVALAPLVAAGALKPEVLTGLLAKAKVKLRGPDLNTMTDIAINADGTFSTGANLMAGSYQVELPVNDDDVAAGLAAAGIAFVGESMVVTVEAGGSATVNFPFRITMQTLMAVAVMGNAEETGAPVEGVELALYANADMTGMLGEATSDEMGRASFTFARADNTGPGGNDNIVFVKVKSTGHDALAVSENDFTEVSYASTDRVSNAPAAAKLVNVMANFQFWVKSDADARGGDMGLGDWHTEVTMGEDTVPLMMVDEDGDTVNATMPTDTAMASRGRAGLSYTVEPGDLPATFTVMAAETQAGAMGEKWEQSDALTHTHTGLMHPDMNTAEMNDLGPIYVTYTTQKLTVGVYREVDDEPGWTDYRAPMGGDKRPEAAVAGEMSAQLMARDSRNRLRPYEYDHDGKATTDPISSMPIGDDGTATFSNLPANDKLTVRFHVGSDRMLVGETDVGDVDAFGEDLDIGMSHGSFGDEGGAMPEVKLCSLSTDEDEDKCATFAYQWKTGSVSGSVEGPGGASVSLTAKTEADDRSTKTGTKGATLRKFSISDIQDGEYTLTTPNTADNSFTPKGGFKNLEIYHNEKGEKEEGDESEYVGTAYEKNDAAFTATKLRQSIKGYVANDDDSDKQSRGDESVSGVEVRLLKVAKDGVSKDKKDTTFVVAAETTTDRSGLYEFNNLTQNEEFYVQVPRGDNHVGFHTKYGEICDDLEADKCANQSGMIKPDEYPDLEAQEGEFALPSWDHTDNTASNHRVTVAAPAPNTNNVEATLVNFALVYTDNEVAGKVTNVSGSNGGITVELGHCERYTAANLDASVKEDCDWSEGDRQTKTDSKGNYSFEDLLEGYYEVRFLGSRFASVRLDTDGDPDPDGAEDTEVTMHIADVMGQDDYDGGNNFTVYNTRDEDDIGLAEVTVTGDTGGDEDTESETTISGTDVTLSTPIAITWAAKSVTVDAEADDNDASVSVAAFDGDGTATPTPKRRGCSSGACTISYNPSDEGDGTGDDADPGETTIEITVTAENGYHKEVYTLTGVTRAEPIDHAPAGITVEDASGVSSVILDMTTTLSGADAATRENAALHIDRVETLECVQTIKKVVADGENVSGTSRGSDDCKGERFSVPLSSTRTTIVRITMTSEDGVDRVYQLTINRS